VHSAIADLIKHLSDNNADCDSRLVIVGVARSAEALLGGHESIARCGDEIWVRPLRNKDISDFLLRAEDALEFKFAPRVKQSLVLEANGYPYYVHLLGLLSIETMLARNKRARVVSEDDFLRLRNARGRSPSEVFWGSTDRHCSRFRRNKFQYFAWWWSIATASCLGLNWKTKAVAGTIGQRINSTRSSSV